MSQQSVQLGILCADVCGSTRLYEELGDQRAQAAIGACLDFLAETSARFGGVVIKTIGDEAVIHFPSADATVEAACEIQRSIERGATFAGERLLLRTGLHFGTAQQLGREVVGDAVVIAELMSNLAKATQVITTRETVDALDGALALRARDFDRIEVRGRSEPVTLCEILWEDQALAADAVVDSLGAEADRAGRFEVSHGDQSIELVPGGRESVTLGRDVHCDISVDPKIVRHGSRTHCRIELHRGKYRLVDESTNGTFVCTADGETVYVHRETLLLWGRGWFGLGERVNADEPSVVHYRVIRESST